MECRLTNQIIRATNSWGEAIRIQLGYLVTGAGSPEGTDPGAAVIAQVCTTSPDKIGHLPRKQLEISRCAGQGIYEVLVEYAAPQSHRNHPPLAGQVRWSFDAAGSSSRVYSGELLQSQAPADKIAPDPGNAINWNGQSGSTSQITGAEKIIPAFRESAVVTWNCSQIDSSFKRRIMELTGCVNSDNFHGWQAGEVLFLGASSSLEYESADGEKLLDVTYRFAVRPNRPPEPVNGINLSSVTGWDVVWEIGNSDPRTLKREILGAYVSRIYEFANFQQLGIPH